MGGGTERESRAVFIKPGCEREPLHSPASFAAPGLSSILGSVGLEGEAVKNNKKKCEGRTFQNSGAHYLPAKTGERGKHVPRCAAAGSSGDVRTPHRLSASLVHTDSE